MLISGRAALEIGARIRVSLAQREVEIEGSEAFVERHLARLDGMLERFARGPVAAVQDATPGDDAGPDLGPFGAFVQHLPNAATEVDRMLAAGFWSQARSADDAFATAEASRLLAEHGFKIGNPSQCVRQSLMAKRVFMVQRGRYRVAQSGRLHLRQLMGAAMPG
jgi:hypothetical protein